MSNLIADKLDEARALIEKGWCQEAFERASASGTCYCAMGAIYRVACADDESVEEDALQALVKTLGYPADESVIFAWNDAPDRTQAEVVEAFRKAAELARAERSAFNMPKGRS